MLELKHSPRSTKREREVVTWVEAIRETEEERRRL